MPWSLPESYLFSTQMRIAEKESHPQWGRKRVRPIPPSSQSHKQSREERRRKRKRKRGEREERWRKEREKEGRGERRRQGEPHVGSDLTSFHLTPNSYHNTILQLTKFLLIDSNSIWGQGGEAKDVMKSSYKPKQAWPRHRQPWLNREKKAKRRWILGWRTEGPSDVRTLYQKGSGSKQRKNDFR